MHIHLIGVAGTGMGALAGLFKALGHVVSGSDTAFYPPMGPALERWGVRCLEGFSAEHLTPKPDLVVVGNVCRADNVEARAAIDGGLVVTTMAHALAEHALAYASPLVVAGTHGKTTTSSLAAFLLDEAGLAPGFLIGGIPKSFGQSFRPAASARRLPVAGAPASLRKPPFVVEGDEYDTAFFEKTPKFWHYRPEVAVLSSIELDHIDIYPDDAAYDAAFAGFIERLPEGGLLVANAADPRVRRLVKAHARCEVTWVALEGDEAADVPPHWLIAPVQSDATGQTFDLYAGGVLCQRAAFPMPGRHNLRNAGSALAAVCQGFGVPIARALGALARFEGVKRRQDLLYTVRGIRVYDDFAHHPTAVRETLDALRGKHAEGRLWAVFEPRSATACRRLHQEAYGTAFGSADRVVLAPLGRSNVPPDERLDLGSLAEALGDKAFTPPDGGDAIASIVGLLAEEAAPGDTIALLSNGAFGNIYERLGPALERAGDGAHGAEK